MTVSTLTPPSPIKSIQRGTITCTTSPAVASATGTIVAVDTAKSVLANLGVRIANATGGFQDLGDINLGSSVAIIFERGLADTTAASRVRYQVTEYT